MDTALPNPTPVVEGPWALLNSGLVVFAAPNRPAVEESSPSAGVVEKAWAAPNRPAEDAPAVPNVGVKELGWVATNSPAEVVEPPPNAGAEVA